MIPSISNNNYILKVGDLIKFIKETKYVNSIRVKINSYYFITEIWDTTNGDIVLKNKDGIQFVINPSYVDKVLNYNNQQLEVAWVIN